MLYQFEILSVTAAPFFELGSSSDPGVKLGASPAFFQQALTTTPRGLAQVLVEAHPKRNYIEQWNLNLQHEFAPDLTLSLGYVGSHGVHQPFRVDDANIVLPTRTPQGYLWPATPGTPVNPNAGTIRALWWDAGSSYNALELDLHARIRHNFQLQANLTCGKSLDNNSATIAGDPFANSVPALDWYDSSLSYGRSDFDIARAGTVDALFDLPDDPRAHALHAFARNGWELTGIYKQSTGSRFTPLIGGDPLGKGGTAPWDFPDRIPACDSILHNFKSNGLRYVNLACFPVPGGANPNPHLRGNRAATSSPPPASRSSTSQSSRTTSSRRSLNSATCSSAPNCSTSSTTPTSIHPTTATSNSTTPRSPRYPPAASSPVPPPPPPAS